MEIINSSDDAQIVHLFENYKSARNFPVTTPEENNNQHPNGQKIHFIELPTFIMTDNARRGPGRVHAIEVCPRCSHVLSGIDGFCHNQFCR